MSSVLISQLIFIIYFLIPLASLDSSYFSQYVVAVPCAFNVGRLLGAKYKITVITERCHSVSVSS